jgi:uncharacterized membrane protein
MAWTTAIAFIQGENTLATYSVDKKAGMSHHDCVVVKVETGSAFVILHNLPIRLEQVEKRTTTSG